MLLVVLLLAPPCLSQRWVLLGGYTGFEGELDAGATAQVTSSTLLLVLMVLMLVLLVPVVVLVLFMLMLENNLYVTSENQRSLEL